MPHNPTPEELQKLATRLGKDRVLLEPYYHDVKSEIKQVERIRQQSEYFWRKWVPRLGPTLTGLVIALRSHCYYNKLTGEIRDVCSVELERLAAEIGVSRYTIMRELDRPIAGSFIRRELQYRYNPTTKKKVRVPNLYRIAMDDPLVPEDEEQLALKIAERILREGLDVRGQVTFSGQRPKTLKETRYSASRQATEHQPQIAVHETSKAPIPQNAAKDEPPKLQNATQVEPPKLQNATAYLSGKMPQQYIVLSSTKTQQQQPSVVVALLNTGITKKTAQELAGKYPATQLEAQLVYLPFRNPDDPAATLVQAIREDWAPPATYLKTQEQEQRAKEKAEKLAVKEKALTDSEARAARLEKLFSTLSPEEQQALHTQAEGTARELMGNTKLPLLTGLVKSQLYTLLETTYSQHTEPRKP